MTNHRTNPDRRPSGGEGFRRTVLPRSTLGESSLLLVLDVSKIGGVAAHGNWPAPGTGSVPKQRARGGVGRTMATPRRRGWLAAAILASTIAAMSVDVRWATGSRPAHALALDVSVTLIWAMAATVILGHLRMTKRRLRARNDDAARLVRASGCGPPPTRKLLGAARAPSASARCPQRPNRSP
jgi:hypothetical protein